MAETPPQMVDWFEHGIDWNRRTVFLVGAVDEEMSEKVLKAFHVFEATDGYVHIKLNSEGGYWTDGMAIYDAIKACRHKVVVSVFGEVSSIASVILQAADVRLMSPNSTMLIHYGTDGTNENASDFQQRAAYGKVLRQKLERIYQRRLGWDKAALRKRMAADWWLTAQEAVKLNLADAVIE